MSEIDFDYDRAVFINGYDNYLLFANGNILNCDTNKWVNGTKTENGYIRVCLSKNNNQKKFLLHQLIAKAFIPNPENKEFVDHINHQKDDNRIINLRWVNQSENNKNQSLSSLNTSGFRGVCFEEKYNRWLAQWYDCITGKPKKKSYPIKKYGAEQALRLAVQSRYDMEQEHNYTLLQTPNEFFQSDEFKNLIT